MNKLAQMKDNGDFDHESSIGRRLNIYYPNTYILAAMGVHISKYQQCLFFKIITETTRSQNEPVLFPVIVVKKRRVNSPHLQAKLTFKNNASVQNNLDQ
jgi:hypothetical protein